MGLTQRSPRHIRRALASTVMLIFLFCLLSSSNHASSASELSAQLWRNKLWKTTFEGARRLLPQPTSASSIAQTPLTSDFNHDRMNATFISLVRNSELNGMLRSIRDVEDRFNRNYHYDWIFLNEEDFTEDFVQAVTTATSGRARIGRVDDEQWSYPAGIDQELAAKSRQELAESPNDIPHGGSESYRHMCRYQSGYFYRHPLALEYEWYWRVEPNIEILCDVPYDPFRQMAENGQKYGFVISLNEISDTVPTLWTHVRAFVQDHPQHVNNDSHLAFISEDSGLTTNYCHFWDNFEIANLDWFRSEAYTAFFDYLDSTGGFFYERWGDASIHSIAASLMLSKGEIHFFDDIGYHHHPLMSCPRSARKRKELNCRCKAEDNMDWYPSCTKRFFEVAGIEFPEGYDRNVPPEPGLLR